MAFVYRYMICFLFTFVAEKYLFTYPYAQLHDKNIHCTIVCPGPVRTAIDRNAVLGDGSLIGCTDKIIQGGMSAER